jgi:hypothetical protein
MARVCRSTVTRRSQYPQIREVAVTAGVVETVAHEEALSDVEADEVGLDSRKGRTRAAFPAQ